MYLCAWMLLKLLSVKALILIQLRVLEVIIQIRLRDQCNVYSKQMSHVPPTALAAAAGLQSVCLHWNI